jgi:hypothetical protein
LGGIIPAGRELLQGSMKLASQAGTFVHLAWHLHFDLVKKIGTPGPVKDSNNSGTI